MPVRPARGRRRIRDRRYPASDWPGSRRRTPWYWAGSPLPTRHCRAPSTTVWVIPKRVQHIGEDPAARAERGAPGDHVIALRSMHSSALVIAAMPLACALHASAPSIAAIRSSSIATVGFWKREYCMPAACAGEAVGDGLRVVVAIAAGEEQRLAGLAMVGAPGARAHGAGGGAPMGGGGTVDAGSLFHGEWRFTSVLVAEQAKSPFAPAGPAMRPRNPDDTRAGHDEEKYGWVHTSVGLLGNILFVCGSVLFLPRFHGGEALPVDDCRPTLR